jgi:hypothetical protein
MGLIDAGVRPWSTGRAVVFPGVCRIHHHAFRHHRCAVAPIRNQIVTVYARAIAIQGIVPADLAVQQPRIRVDQQLVGIEAMAVLGLVGSVYAIAVELPRPKAGDIPMPDLVRSLRKRDPAGLVPPIGIVETQIDGCGVRGE